jgi:hypothetical protein
MPFHFGQANHFDVTAVRTCMASTMPSGAKNQKIERIDGLRVFFLSWWLVCPAHLVALMELSNVNLHQDPIHFFWLVAMFVSSLAWLAVFLYFTIRRLKLGWFQYSKFSLMLLTQILVLLSRS